MMTMRILLTLDTTCQVSLPEEFEVLSVTHDGTSLESQFILTVIYDQYAGNFTSVTFYGFLQDAPGQISWGFTTGVPVYATGTPKTLFTGVHPLTLKPITVLSFVHYLIKNPPVGLSDFNNLENTVRNLTGQLNYIINNQQPPAPVLKVNDYKGILQKCNLKFTLEEKEEVFKTWPVESLPLYEVIFNLVNQLYE